jgi:hypothetical protein
MRKIMMGSKLSSKKTRPQRNEDINISALLGMSPINDNAWLIGSGSTRHMTGLTNHLIHFVEKETHLHVVLGDDVRYNVRGVGTSTFQLDSNMQIKLEEVSYVLGMKRKPCLYFGLGRQRLQNHFLRRKSSCMAQRLSYNLFQIS